MTFLSKALRFDSNALVSKILGIKLAGWTPKFVVLHNTAAPSLEDWLAYSQAQKESWGDNLNTYYRKMGWHSGPHLAATPDFTYQLCDLTADGVHASCFNKISYGIETVGDFKQGGDNPTYGAGLLAVTAAINALAALHVRFNWDPADYSYGVKGLHFHCECKADNHACPGAQIDKDNIIKRVIERMNEIKNIQVPNIPVPLVSSNLPHEETPMPPTIELAEWPPDGDPFFQLGARAFNKLKSLGYDNPAALGILAQAEAESSLNVGAIGDKDTAFGLFQWHQPRIDFIKNGCGIDIKTDSLIENHIAAAHFELHNAERPALMKITTAKTALDAGVAAAVFYERAGAPLAAQRRGAMSERWAVLFSSDKGKALLANNPAKN